MIETILTPAFALAFFVTIPQQKPVLPTPNDSDIPKPLQSEISLAGADSPDITRFLQVRTAGSPRLSPDGTRLAFLTNTTGTAQIWMTRAGAAEPVWPDQLTFGEPITTIAYSPAGDWILYGCDRSGNEREGYYLITPDGTKEKELLAPSEKFRVFGGFSPDGQKIAYATTGRTPVDFDIHILDIASGDDRKVYEGKAGMFVSSWRPDGSGVLISETRGEDGNDLHYLDLATGKLDTLCKPAESARYNNFEWRADGSGFYMTTDQDRDFAALVYYDFTKKEMKAFESPNFDVDDCSLSSDGTYLAWITNEGGYSFIHIRDLTKNADVPVRKLPRGLHTILWAKRAPVLAITTNGPLVPGDIWIFDARTGETTRATRSASAGLDLMQCVAPQPLSFKARDGETVYGLLYLPKHPAGADITKKPPVLVGVHGGPTSQARPSFSASQQYLISRGIAIFDLNFRGSTGYGKRFARLDNLRLRPNAVRDVADAVEFLRKDGRVDASRAAIMGGSYGGYLTYAAVTQLPDVFRGGVSMVGVSNWVTALEGASPGLKASDRLEYGNIDDPEDRKFFVELSPITHVKNVKVPVMVIHGANDPRDPVAESDQFVRAVREQGGEVEYMRFPDEGHGIRKLSNRIICYRRVAGFLEKLLGVDRKGG
ncbi:MAG: prolyl oligopeptidase family serine peptidase [Planctomycetota bacterium]